MKNKTKNKIPFFPFIPLVPLGLVVANFIALATLFRRVHRIEANEALPV